MKPAWTTLSVQGQLRHSKILCQKSGKMRTGGGFCICATILGFHEDTQDSFSTQTLAFSLSSVLWKLLSGDLKWLRSSCVLHLL